MCVLLCCPVLLQAGAAEKGVPLYKYIAQIAGNSKLVSSNRAAAAQHSAPGSSRGSAAVAATQQDQCRRPAGSIHVAHAKARFQPHFGVRWLAIPAAGPLMTSRWAAKLGFVLT